ncbi:MAG TPA: IS630 family transposase [Bryobacteraceae bacterium]|nr:IS630 family transposase [Bryobacteraceae bacterium]
MRLIVVRITRIVRLSEQQRNELTSIAQSRSRPAGYVFRAKLILMLAESATFAAIRERLGTTTPTIIRWKERFLAAGMDGLDTSHPGQQPYRLTPSLRAKVLNATRKKPTDGSTHWSCRKLAQALGISKDLVHRIWQEAGIKPHRLERYMASNDPDFEIKAADIIGLYLNPPQHAAVFCVDEKTAIQALDRLDPVLPLSPGRAERHGFEYYRHGTLSLYAALDTKTGKVQAKTAARHTSTEFVAFLTEVVASRPAKQDIHIILDNLSAHKTKLVNAFLADHPNVHLHFTPTYSSWLNQVEIWFARIERDVISRGVFSSVSDLARKLRRYIRAYSAQAKPFLWKYSDPTRHLGNVLFATGH